MALESLFTVWQGTQASALHATPNTALTLRLARLLLLLLGGGVNPVTAMVPLGCAPFDTLGDVAGGVEAAPLQLPAGLYVVEQQRAALLGLDGQAVPRALAELGAVVAGGGGEVGEHSLATLLNVTQEAANGEKNQEVSTS